MIQRLENSTNPAQAIEHIPFNHPFVTGREIQYIKEAIANNHLSGNGEFTKRCQNFLKRAFQSSECLLTHSATAALEMSALLLDISKGDEVIMPSFTFVSTANAFVLRGATPVFVDIREDTLNIDAEQIAEAITPRTRAIVPVHYAGVLCEMDRLSALAKAHGLPIVEDAAHAFGSTRELHPPGHYADLAVLSFHETKNIISGEGGALLINNDGLRDRAQILWEKGTNRRQYFEGLVDKYTWVDQGSSFLPGEIVAAFLLAQIEQSEKINAQRLVLWEKYHGAFASLENREKVRRPIIPQDCAHNAHMYYLLLNTHEQRQGLLAHLAEKNINAVFHYVPLHSSPGGKRFGRAAGEMKNTDSLSSRLLRLPLWNGMEDSQLERVVSEVENFFS